MTWREPLGDGLVLRPLRDERDAQRFVAHNEAITGEGPICERLTHHHPNARLGDFFLVEDEDSGEVASTTCLLPWRCRYEGIALDVAMLEMVVTAPAYRRRGLVRAQIDHFHRLAAERGFDLCIIQGIPYYYRQFGYAYALDHTPADALPAGRVPAWPEAAARHTVRRSTPAHASPHAALYQQAMAAYSLHVERDAAYWDYLLRYAGWGVQIVERAGEAMGYIVARPPADGAPLRVAESALRDADAARAALGWLAAQTPGELILGGSAQCRLIRLARSLGAAPRPRDQWLLRLPDAAKLLAKLAPVLERRLAASSEASYTGSLTINCYRQALALRWERGRLAAVEPLGFVDASMGSDGGDLCIPPDAFTRLVVGYRSLDALRDAWPDIVIRPAARALLDALFPPRDALIWMPY